MSSLWSLNRLQVELINVCNYRCPLCRTLDRDGVRRRKMRLEEFTRIIEPVKDEVKWLALYGTRGEPFLHTDLENIVKKACRLTAAKIVISTNGSLLTPVRSRQILDAGLSEIIFAVDGLTQASYESYRVRGNLENVILNIRQFCEIKNAGNYPTHAIFQFIPMKSNEHEISQVTSFGRELGVDEVRLKLSSSVTKSDVFRTSSLQYSPPEVSRSEFECPNGLDFLYVDPNGDCFPCCYAEGHDSLLVGNALTDSTAAIWNSYALWNLRRSFADQKDFNDFCVTTCQGVSRRTRQRLYQITKADH